MIKDQRGLTIVELNIVLVMTALFIALILYFGMSYWRYASLLESDLDTFVSRLNAQDYIRENVGNSTGLIMQNSIQDANAMNPDPIDGPYYWEEIHAVPGNTPVGTSGTTPLLYYTSIATQTDGTVALNGEIPYENEFILYLDGDRRQLLSRSLANPAVTDNALTTSCPPSLATPSCPADKVIMENLDSVDAIYYSRSGNSIDHESIIDTTVIPNVFIGPDFPLVEALQYTFHIKGKPLFQTEDATINDTIVRIALRNT